VDETEWNELADPRQMLGLLTGIASDRKLRLFGAHCCQVLVDVLDDRGLTALATAERFAEGLCGPDELEQARSAANDAFCEFDDSHSWGPGGRLGWESAANAIESICHRDDLLTFLDGVCLESAVVSAVDQPPQLKRAMRRLALLNQSRLLRDIFGNPFRPVEIDPRWRTSDVVGLARAIYDDRGFERMPILADALMDAGCENEEIIGHCRGGGPHVRGCWVVDMILGKE